MRLYRQIDIGTITPPLPLPVGRQALGREARDELKKVRKKFSDWIEI
jgi:hypothetical protein